MGQQNLDLAVGLRAPVTGLRGSRLEQGAVVGEDPAAAGICQERFAGDISELDFLAEPERLDRRIVTDARAFPAAE
jgi:hypothetical protein